MYEYPCLTNFTTFNNQYYYSPNKTSYLDISLSDCSNLCLNLNATCKSFNYNIEYNKCDIIENIYYNINNFTYNYNNIFYMKSYNYCFNSYDYPFYLIITIFICVFIPLCCISMYCKNRNSRRYLERSQSETALVEESIPPPYNETDTNTLT